MLLQIYNNVQLTNCNDPQESFDALVSRIPCWMFIEWLPQLLAHIPSEAGLSAAKTVRLVAQAYPGSLTYIWRVSHYGFRCTPTVS
jgi:hypothetical protein